MIATAQFFSIQGIVCHQPLWFDGRFFLTCAALKALRSTAKIFIVISLFYWRAKRRDKTVQDKTGLSKGLYPPTLVLESPLRATEE